MYERRHQPLVPRRVFYRRLARNAGFALLLLGGSLALGVLGYHFTEGIGWLDALLNANQQNN